ncbi:MAG: ABC transporter ATP-binding protein, partial [Promethearchaeota archaeon]
MRKSKKRKEVQFLNLVLQEVMDDEEMKPDSMIQVFDLTKVYNITEGVEVRALNGVSLDIEKGEFVSVMGPSGSGKTTLLNMIGALDNPTSGAVYINRTNIAHMNDKQRTNLRLKEIGFIFQFYNLVPVLSAYENVELPMLFAAKPEKERKKMVN